MIDPIFCIWFTVERSVLDKNVFVGWIKPSIADSRGFAGEGGFDADALEEGGADEIDVLTRVGEEAHHAECHKGAHGAAVVVAWEAGFGGLEVGWDIVVGALGRESWPAGVVVLEHSEKGGFVADICDLLIVEEIESVDKSSWSAEGGDEGCLIVGYEKGIFPDGRFKGLACGVLQRAYAVWVGVNVGAVEWVLAAPGLVQVFGLEEAGVAGVCAVGERRGLIGFEEVFPVGAAGLVFLYVVCFVEAGCDLGDGEVVVAVFECA